MLVVLFKLLWFSTVSSWPKAKPDPSSKKTLDQDLCRFAEKQKINKAAQAQ
jgi:hypothetical protein